MTTEQTYASVDRSVKQWSGALALLALASAAFSIYAILNSFAGDEFKIALDTESGVRVLTNSDFTRRQLWTVICIVASSDLCLAVAMLQIVFLSRRFAKGEFLTHGVVVCLQRFGWGLFIVGLVEAVMFPILNAYLVGQELIEPMKDVMASAIGSGMLTSMMAAVLLMVIAKILGIGIELREDVELTI